MRGDSLTRRVLAGLLRPDTVHGTAPAPAFAGHPLRRRVLAGLLGVTLPSRAGPSESRAQRSRDGGGLVFQFSRLGVSAARTSGDLHPIEATWRLDDGITVRCHNRPGMDQIEIFLVTTRPEWREVLLPVEVAGTAYLMLVGAAGREAEGRVVARTREVSPEIVFLPPPRPLSSLGPSDVEMIRRSVHGSSNAGMNLWRKVAKERDHDDPVRAAIVEALP